MRAGREVAVGKLLVGIAGQSHRIQPIMKNDARYNKFDVSNSLIIRGT